MDVQEPVDDLEPAELGPRGVLALWRLVTENCDAVVSIPIQATTESLNAGIAASVTLYQIATLRAAKK